ncbi:MAG TPA: cupin domain-containing protein [Ornithinimicrobium sp.]|uniref:cupin domain-containing protein n=1 Tax=Ornithinimicrobium sp. TaxID=1977084 RepID=UPI002B47F7D5|nr:cupin domain-containing protein [Ornithinimicrobium sp.]HKJ12929.1 cupin domain-containing protein [Ornithinimicrobium sp.]
MDTTRPDPPAHAVIAPGSGTHYHFLNHLSTVKVAAEGRRSMSVMHFEGTRGMSAPLHRHEYEDELFVVLAGELAFTLGEEQLAGPTGSVAYLPHSVPHTFQVVSDSATVITVCASRSQTPRFDEMIAALGSPLDEPVLPADVAIDPAEVKEVCAAYGITVLGPPPPPLP